MSSSVPIPKPPARRDGLASSYSSSTSSSYSSPPTRAGLSRPVSSKGKEPVAASPTETISPRRPSLLGSSLAQSEHIVINLGHSDGPPRLVTCVKSSQGFDWNQELFLPSYANHDSHDLETRQDPVQDIILTEEEMASMLPQ